MPPMTDYEEQTRDINLIMDTKITALRRIICYNQSIYDDKRLEVSEYIGLGLIADNTLSTFQTAVQPKYNASAILIIDNDSKFHIDNGSKFHNHSFLGGSSPNDEYAFSLCVLPHHLPDYTCMKFT